MAGRLGILPQAETKGLNTFVANFSLPCLIFLSIAELDLSSVNWTFLLAILVAKAIVFLGVVAITLVVSVPDTFLCLSPNLSKIYVCCPF